MFIFVATLVFSYSALSTEAMQVSYSSEYTCELSDANTTVDSEINFNAVAPVAYYIKIHTVIFVNASLPVFPTNLFDYLPVLSNVTARGAGIKDISSLGDPTTQRVYSMRTLVLAANNITTLASMAFNRLHRLTFLDVSFNQIADIDLDAFKGNSELNQLILAGNLLQALIQSVFSTLDSLKKLDVSQNQLKELDLNQFSGIMDMLSISANQNEIQTIIADNDNPLVHALYIGGNHLDDISNLTRLPGLQTLFLNDNPLTVDGEFFAIMPQLTQLVLDATNWNGNCTIFAPLQNLTLLSLSNNSLKSFEVAKFPKLTKLTHLYLDKNHLTTLDFENIIVTFPRLQVIGISKNRFECVFLKFMVEHFERIKYKKYLQFADMETTSDFYSRQDLECVAHSIDPREDFSSRLVTMMAVFSDIDRAKFQTVEYLESSILELQGYMEEMLQALSQKVEILEDISFDVQRQPSENVSTSVVASILLSTSAIVSLLISSVLAGFYVFDRTKQKQSEAAKIGEIAEIGETFQLREECSRRNSQYVCTTEL